MISWTSAIDSNKGEVELLFPVPTVDAFDEGILVGLAGLSEADIDRRGTTPVGKGLPGQLRPAIAPDRLGPAVPLDELFQKTNHAYSRNAQRHVDSERSTTGLIHHITFAKYPSAVMRVAHDIERRDRTDSIDLRH